MERRVFLAISLAILVLYLYQVFLMPPPPVRPEATPASATPATSPAVPADTSSPAPSLESDAPGAPEALVGDTARREITVRTGVTEVVLTNVGGRVLHWRLNNYLDEDKDRPVDLVPTNLPPGEPLPFSLATDDPEVTRRLNDALYVVVGGRTTVDATTAPASVTFEYQEASGLRARKTFEFRPDSYEVLFSADVVVGAQRVNPTIQWGPGLGDLGARSAGGSFFTGNYVQPPSAILHFAGDVERVQAGSIEASTVFEQDLLFAGVDDHYFLAAAIEPGRARVEYRTLRVNGGDASRQFVAHAIRLADGPQPLRYFMGPKRLEVLRDVGIDGQLAYAINFGVFTWLIVPLLETLKWVYGFVGNWGWAIIVLTILINIVIAPLRHKSLVSMRKMQAIQPQVKAIQERYADLKITDPARQKMNTEIMNLYREKGANPAAGCVPMLLTMPVLFSFYSMLSQAIELRGAEFIFWIQDLSSRDPYFVTPLLMGATMFWQMRISPTTADPTQQRIMMFMPVMFTALFLGFPSGLAIYYLVMNLCQIGQQYFTNRTIPPPAVLAAAKPAKSAGSGQTPAASKSRK